jgi:hypothetical protein
MNSLGWIFGFLWFSGYTFYAFGSNSSLVAPKQRHQAATMLPYPAVSKVRKVGGGPRVRMAKPKELRTEVRKLRNTQKTLHKALRLLFELLEEYSPMWYQRHYHNQARAALKRVERTSDE